MFVPILIMRYTPGSVLEGGIPVDVVVDTVANEDVAEDIAEDIEVGEEEDGTEIVDCCCAGWETLLFLFAAASPPATPPPIAAPITRSTSANAIQNVRRPSPQMRDGDVKDDVSMYGGGALIVGWGATSSP